jgi:hypothetical protein
MGAKKSDISKKTLPDIIEEESLEAKKVYNQKAKAEGRPEVSLEKRASVTMLEIGGLAIGTKVYDPSILVGLRYFLEANGYEKKINNIIVAGGMVPFVPPHYAKIFSEYMRGLGNKPGCEDYGEAVKTVIEQMQLEGVQKEYMDKYFKGKITTLGEAEAYSKEEFRKFLEPFKNAAVDYFPGLEDHWNMAAAREVERQNYSENKSKDLEVKIAERKNLIRENNDLEKSIKLENREIKDHQQYLKIVSKLNNELNKCKTDEERENCLKVWKNDKRKLREVPHGEKGYIESMISLTNQPLNDAVKSVNDRLKETNDLIEEARNSIKHDTEQIETNKGKISDYEREIARQKSFMGNKLITKFTGHVDLNPAEEEMLWKKVKDAYKDRYAEMFKGYNLRTHISRQSSITVSVENEEVKFSEAFNEIDLIKLKSSDLEKLVVVMSKMGPTARPILNAIQNVAKELAYKAKMEAYCKDKEGNPIMGEVPDVFIVANEGGGFRAKPFSKYYEPLPPVGSTEKISASEICMAVQIPGLESLILSEIMREKGLKDKSTKKQEQKRTASGAVIHTMRDDGTHLVEYADWTYLKELGEMASQLEKLDKNSKEYTELKQKLESRANLKKSAPRKTLVLGDNHVGSGAPRGYKTSLEYIDMAKNYVNQNYITIDRLAASELVNGDIPIKVQSPYHEWGPIPSAIETEMREFYEKGITEIYSSGKTGPERELALKDLAWKINQEWKHVYQIRPINGISMQMDEVNERVRELFTKTLESGGELVFISGNHPNKVCPGYDEAKELARMVYDLKKTYKDKIVVIEGQGCQTGSTGTLTEKDGRKTYFCHVTARGSGQDAVLGDMGKMLGSANPASHFIAYHIHQAEFGFADGTAHTVAAGMQPSNLYIVTGGLRPAPKGFVTIYDLQNNPGYVAWETVLGNTLEKYYDKDEPPITKTATDKAPEGKKSKR